MCKSDKEIKEINVYRMFELEHSDKNSFLIFALDRKVNNPERNPSSVRRMEITF